MRAFVCELAMFVYVLWLCILFKVVSPSTTDKYDMIYGIWISPEFLVPYRIHAIPYIPPHQDDQQSTNVHLFNIQLMYNCRISSM